MHCHTPYMSPVLQLSLGRSIAFRYRFFRDFCLKFFQFPGGPGATFLSRDMLQGVRGFVDLGRQLDALLVAGLPSRVLTTREQDGKVNGLPLPYEIGGSERA